MQLCMVLGIPILLFFGISDLGSERPFVNAAPDFAVALLFMIISLLLRKIQHDLFAIRTSMLAISTLLLLNTFHGVGENASALWIYTLPVFSAFLFSKKEGLMWTLFTAGGAIFIVGGGEAIHAYPYSSSFSFRFATTLILVTILTFTMETLRHKFWRQLQEQKLLVEKKNRELSEQAFALEKALTEIKTLSGLLPICSHCKKIRDDRGYWSDIEHYIISHTDAQLSHSICTTCLKEEFPKLYNEMVRNGEIDESTNAEIIARSK
ncbi:MAG: hypothetical protein JXR45_19915 [Deltaproteobacteria bacterium]|nr:hypothetical protein [Deltaproteobacteria bacterium]